MLGLKVEKAVSAGGKASALIMTCGNVRVLVLPREQQATRHPVLLPNVGISPCSAGVQIEFSCEKLAEIARRLERVGVPDTIGDLLMLNQKRPCGSGRPCQNNVEQDISALCAFRLLAPSVVFPE